MTISPRRRQIEARFELLRRITTAVRDLADWRAPHEELLPLDTPGDTRVLFNEAQEVLARLRTLANRDIDDALG